MCIWWVDYKDANDAESHIFSLIGETKLNL
jgi:hypothetical protein